MDPIRIIIVAVGGQGNLLASKVLGEAALLSDIPVRMSEIHGMAQRGGVVESALVFGDARSTIISDGEADVLVGFEPSETLRALSKCSPKTVVITNLAPLPPFTVAVDLDQNLAHINYARLALEELPARPDQITAALEKNLNLLDN